jgi:hypothetical protein
LGVHPLYAARICAEKREQPLNGRFESSELGRIGLRFHLGVCPGIFFQRRIRAGRLVFGRAGWLFQFHFSVVSGP